VDWECSGCNRHYSWAVTECPHCQPVVTVTSTGTQNTSHNSESKPCCKATFALVLEHTLSEVEKCPVCGTPV